LPDLKPILGGNGPESFFLTQIVSQGTVSGASSTDRCDQASVPDTVPPFRGVATRVRPRVTRGRGAYFFFLLLFAVWVSADPATDFTLFELFGLLNSLEAVDATDLEVFSSLRAIGDTFG
jgi:hypothetical protein